MEYVLEHVGEPEWEEVMVFVCGLIDNATQVVQAVAETDPLLAAKCTTYAKEIDGKVADELALTLIRKLRQEFRTDTWVGKLYHDMFALLSIESKTSSGMLTDLFRIAYDQHPRALYDFAYLLTGIYVPEKAIAYLGPLVSGRPTDVGKRVRKRIGHCGSNDLG